MRTSMLPSLLGVLKTNYSRRLEEAGVFEISYVYRTEEKELTKLPEHVELLSLGQYGMGGFFEFKGVVESLLDSLQVKNYEFKAESGNPSMHPGRTALLLINGKNSGTLGQIHPETANNFECPEGTYVAFINLKDLVENSTEIQVFKELPKYPAVSRDLAVLMDVGHPAGEIDKFIRTRAGKLLESCKLFDVYQGEQVPEGKKSMAYSLTFRDPEKTLTDQDVEKIMKKVLGGLEYTYGAQLR
jgi:phenylalanyl-tRNA synthetase beta chain